MKAEMKYAFQGGLGGIHFDLHDPQFPSNFGPVGQG